MIGEVDAYFYTYKLKLAYCPGPEAVIPDAVKWLYTVVIEPLWLQRVAWAQCDPSKSELGTLISCVHGLDATFS